MRRCCKHLSLDNSGKSLQKKLRKASTFWPVVHFSFVHFHTDLNWFQNAENFACFFELRKDIFGQLC